MSAGGDTKSDWPCTRERTPPHGARNGCIGIPARMKAIWQTVTDVESLRTSSAARAANPSSRETEPPFEAFGVVDNTHIRTPASESAPPYQHNVDVLASLPAGPLQLCQPEPVGNVVCRSWCDSGRTRRSITVQLCAVPSLRRLTIRTSNWGVNSRAEIPQVPGSAPARRRRDRDLGRSHSNATLEIGERVFERLLSGGGIVADEALADIAKLVVEQQLLFVLPGLVGVHEISHVSVESA